MSKPTSVTVRVCACPAALLEEPSAEPLDDDVVGEAASLLPPQAVSSPSARARPPAAATRRAWDTDTGPPGGPAAGAPDGSGPLSRSCNVQGDSGSTCACEDRVSAAQPRASTTSPVVARHQPTTVSSSSASTGSRS